MKRKAYFLAETLMGMALQAILALSLMGAFYMLMTFSSSLSQTLDGFDRGQMVISYVDNRIRNAGLGLWNCNYVSGVESAPSPKGVAEAFEIASSWNNIHLPVAVTSKTGSGTERLSKDSRYYEGNILTLLYAHKDTKKPDELLVFYSKSADAVVIPEDASSPDFRFIDYRSRKNYSAAGETNFNLSAATPDKKNLKSWGVFEASGLPVMVSNFDINFPCEFTLTAPHKHDIKVYPMSELLNLELKRMYVAADSSGVRNFTNYDIKDNINDGFDTAHPHYVAKDILEVYFRLDTKPDIPLLDMKVLVNDGERESGDVECPAEWPSGYWQDDFGKYNFHIEQAQWRLYNLTGWAF